MPYGSRAKARVIIEAPGGSNLTDMSATIQEPIIIYYYYFILLTLAALMRPSRTAWVNLKFGSPTGRYPRVIQACSFSYTREREEKERSSLYSYSI